MKLYFSALSKHGRNSLPMFLLYKKKYATTNAVAHF